MAAVSKANSKDYPKWKVREQLILASAVQRSGDQNWVSVSRCMKPFVEESRSSDMYSQKNCATQYSMLLDKASTPRRKRKEDGTQESVETVEEQIVRHLTSKRIKELDKTLAKMKEEYLSMKKEIEMAERGELDSKLLYLLDESNTTKITHSVSSESIKKSHAPLVSSSTPSISSEADQNKEQEKVKKVINFEKIKDKIEERKKEMETAPSNGTTTQSKTTPTIEDAVPVTNKRVKIEEALEEMDTEPVAMVTSKVEASKKTAENSQPSKTIKGIKEAKIDQSNQSEVAPAGTSLSNESSEKTVQNIKVFDSTNNEASGTGDKPQVHDKTILLSGGVESSGRDTENQKKNAPPNIAQEMKSTNISLKSLEASQKGDKNIGEKSDYVPSNSAKISETIKQEPMEMQDSHSTVTTSNRSVNDSVEIKIEVTAVERETVDSTDSKKEMSAVAKDQPSSAVLDKTINDKQPVTMEIRRKGTESENKEDDKEKMASEKPRRKLRGKRQNDKLADDDKPITEDDKGTESETEDEYKDETEEEEEDYEDRPLPRRIRTKRGAKKRDKSWDSRESPLVKSSKSSERNRRSTRLGEKEEGSPVPPTSRRTRNISTPTGRRKGRGRMKAEFRDSPKPDDESDEEPMSSAIPSPATSQGDNESETPQALRTWRKTIMLVWRHAAQHKYANLFLHPVKEEDAPGYYEVILKPMDLSTIKKNIENGVIRTDVEFQREMLLMFQNALMYNSSDHDVYKMAEEMRSDVQENIQEYLLTQLMVQSATSKTLRSRDSKTVTNIIATDEQKPKRGGPSTDDTPLSKKTRIKSIRLED